MTKRDKIIQTLNDFPNLNKWQIAQRVGCRPAYVNQVENQLRKERAKMSEDAKHTSFSDTVVIDADSEPGSWAEALSETPDQKPYVPGLYMELAAVLEAAYNQAAYGKGAERHANDDPWTEQPIFKIAEQVGDGFNAGQVIKKVQEAQQMAARGEYAKAQHEVLGAIVYAASLHVIWGRGGAE